MLYMLPKANHIIMSTKFSDLAIESNLIKALKKQGIFEPFEVQKE